MFIVSSKYLVPRGFVGITIFPFIFLQKKTFKLNKVLINHEHIHLRQQLELGIVFFFIWYAIEYVYRLIIFKDKRKAYRMISFEREAYAFENDMEYVLERKWYSFLKFV